MEFDDTDEVEGLGVTPSVSVEIHGLSLYTHHGVTEAEREIGQRIEFDISIDLEDGCDAVVTDQVEDTVDYGDVCQFVALIAQQQSYRTLERLCNVVAERIIKRYSGVKDVWIKATKPQPPIPLSVGKVAVEVWVSSEDSIDG